MEIKTVVRETKREVITLTLDNQQIHISIVNGKLANIRRNMRIKGAWKPSVIEYTVGAVQEIRDILSEALIVLADRGIYPGVKDD